MNIFTAQSNIWKPSLGSHVLHTFRLKPQILAQDFSSRYRFWQIYICSAWASTCATKCHVFRSSAAWARQRAQDYHNFLGPMHCSADMHVWKSEQCRSKQALRIMNFLWPKSLAAHATSRSMSVSMYTWFNSRYWQTDLFAGDFCMQRLLARMHLIAIPLSRSRLLKARVRAKVANTV